MFKPTLNESTGCQPLNYLKFQGMAAVKGLNFVFYMERMNVGRIIQI
jgi:hypothetical protein